jgi:hypothetical protein
MPSPSSGKRSSLTLNGAIRDILKSGFWFLRTIQSQTPKKIILLFIIEDVKKN